MNSPKISIIIPSYNKVKYIESTLKSIVKQGYKNFEMIIQDGASTDGTLEIIKKYATKYKAFIRYESKKDKGQLDAINKGIKKATGDIITFINADDEYTLGCFETVVGYYLENPGALWFAGKGIVIDENGRDMAKMVSRYKSTLLLINKYNLLLTTNYMMQPSVFLTKKAFKKYGLFRGTKFAVMEYRLWLDIGKDGMPVVINRSLSRFRLENDTKTNKNSETLLFDDEKIVEEFTSNKLLLLLHKLNNFGRKKVLKILK